MSAGSLRERLALALFADEQCDGRQREDVGGNWAARLDDHDKAVYLSLADAVLAEVCAWLGSDEAREVVAKAVSASFYRMEGGTADGAPEPNEGDMQVGHDTLAALIDQTKEQHRGDVR